MNAEKRPRVVKNDGVKRGLGLFGMAVFSVIVGKYRTEVRYMLIP